MSIGKNIAFYRKQLGFTQEELSEKIGVTSQAVSKWENEITTPDVALLTTIANTLSIDMNTLFADEIPSVKDIRFRELADAEYDAMLSVFLSARRSFYGIRTPMTEEEMINRSKKYKEHLRSMNYRSISVCEGEECHGSVLISDAFSFVDRLYGSKESVCLFDMQKAGEILSVLGNDDVRKVLKEVYRSLLVSGEEGTEKTTEELVEQTGLTPDRIDEAARQLVHIRLLDMKEKIENGVYKKRYTGLYMYDFINVLAILRISYILAEDMIYDTQMYRGFDGRENYDGPGNL